MNLLDYGLISGLIAAICIILVVMRGLSDRKMGRTYEFLALVAAVAINMAWFLPFLHVVFKYSKNI